MAEPGSPTYYIHAYDQAKGVVNKYCTDRRQETPMQQENRETVSERAHMLNESQPTVPTQNNSERLEAVEELSGNDCDEVDAVNVQSADVQLCEQIQRKRGYYPIKDFERKGCALILSNAFEEDKIEKRRLPGYNIDKENMRKLCEGLGCNPVDVRTNQNAEKIKNIILDFADKIKDSNPSFIVVVIMSHGGKQKDKQVFDGSDSKPVEVDFVLDSFNNERAPHLQNIPKLFIFQFCRGDKTDEGIKTAGPNSGTSAASNIYQPTNILPVYSDQFVAYPTHDDYTALVGGNGSWFINAITNIFMRYAKDEHVADLFTMVNKAVKYKTGELESGSTNQREVIVATEARLHIRVYHSVRSFGQWLGIIGPDPITITCKEMSVSVSSLTEKLYLYPGYLPASSN